MSEYDNVVVGKLKLKGKSLDVKAGGLKKKKTNKRRCMSSQQVGEHFLLKATNLFTFFRHCRLAKTSNKSHRDQIQDFNQYLANMSEHYDIPKVGPG
ncbi:hypothetical protein MKX01_006537 [Papaver californicum]|nr:hypothetical protein MKX01_006537 [Papaver californicum]